MREFLILFSLHSFSLHHIIYLKFNEIDGISATWQSKKREQTCGKLKKNKLFSMTHGNVGTCSELSFKDRKKLPG